MSEQTDLKDIVDRITEEYLEQLVKLVKQSDLTKDDSVDVG